jgi:hypothetical protein
MSDWQAVAAGLEEDARLDRVRCFAAHDRALRALTGKDVPRPAAPQGDFYATRRPSRLEQASRWRKLVGV